MIHTSECSHSVCAHMWMRLRNNKKNIMCGLNQKKNLRETKKETTENSTLFNTSKKYFTVMYFLNQNRRYFCCSKFGWSIVKNWNSCGLQSPLCKEARSLSHSFHPRSIKRLTAQQMHNNANNFQQQQKRREKFIGQIFSLVLFYIRAGSWCSSVILYAFRMGWKANKSCVHKCIFWKHFFYGFIQNVLHFLDYFDASNNNSVRTFWPSTI